MKKAVDYLSGRPDGTGRAVGIFNLAEYLVRDLAFCTRVGYAWRKCGRLNGWIWPVWFLPELYGKKDRYLMVVDRRPYIGWHNNVGLDVLLEKLVDFNRQHF